MPSILQRRVRITGRKHPTARVSELAVSCHSLLRKSCTKVSAQTKMSKEMGTKTTDMASAVATNSGAIFLAHLAYRCISATLLCQLFELPAHVRSQSKCKQSNKFPESLPPALLKLPSYPRWIEKIGLASIPWRRH